MHFYLRDVHDTVQWHFLCLGGSFPSFSSILILLIFASTPDSVWRLYRDKTFVWGFSMNFVMISISSSVHTTYESFLKYDISPTGPLSGMSRGKGSFFLTDCIADLARSFISFVTFIMNNPSRLYMFIVLSQSG